MKRVYTHTILLTAAFGLTYLLARIDHETKTAWDVFTSENLPALVIFTIVFYVVLLLPFLMLRAVANALCKPDDSRPVY